MIKFENDYAIGKKDLKPVIELVEASKISIDIPIDILNYLQALLIMEREGACIDDWECILADNLFVDCKILTILTKVERDKLTIHMEGL